VVTEKLPDTGFGAPFFSRRMPSKVPVTPVGLPEVTVMRGPPAGARWWRPIPVGHAEGAGDIAAVVCHAEKLPDIER
jgi:hypothetical protein